LSAHFRTDDRGKKDDDAPKRRKIASDEDSIKPHRSITSSASVDDTGCAMVVSFDIGGGKTSSYAKLYANAAKKESGAFSKEMRNIVLSYEKSMRHIDFESYCKIVKKKPIVERRNLALNIDRMIDLVSKNDESICESLRSIYLDCMLINVIPEPIRSVMSITKTNSADHYLFESILKSKVKGQWSVCESVAMLLFSGFKQQQAKILEYTKEFIRKRELGNGYTPKMKTLSMFNSPTITKIHLAGTSGTGKSLMGKTIAEMFGLSEEDKNYVHVSLSGYSDKTNTQLFGSGRGLKGYGDGTDVCTKLKEPLLNHDPKKKYDVDHLFYANPVILSYLRNEDFYRNLLSTRWSAFKKKSRQTTDEDYYSFFLKIKHSDWLYEDPRIDLDVYDDDSRDDVFAISANSKNQNKIGSDTTRSDRKKELMRDYFEYVENNEEYFKSGKIDVKTGLPINIAPAAYYVRKFKSDLKLPAVCSERELSVAFLKHVLNSKIRWSSAVASENDNFAISIDNEERLWSDDQMSNAMQQSTNEPTKTAKIKKKSGKSGAKSKGPAVVETHNVSEEHKASDNPYLWAKGSMRVPELGDYNCNDFPNTILLHLDELDKMNKAGLTLLEHFLETGKAVSSHGESFVLPPSTHLIIVFTSNFGDADIESICVDDRLRKNRDSSDDNDSVMTSKSEDDDDDSIDVEDMIDDDGRFDTSRLDEGDLLRLNIKMGNLRQKYVNCVERSMIDCKITSCYIVRLGAIVPYAPVSPKIMKNVCYEHLIFPASRLGRSQGLMKPIDMISDLSAYNTIDSLENKLLFEIGVVLKTVSCFSWLVALTNFLNVGDKCSKTVAEWEDLKTKKKVRRAFEHCAYNVQSTTQSNKYKNAFTLKAFADALSKFAWRVLIAYFSDDDESRDDMSERLISWLDNVNVVNGAFLKTFVSVGGEDATSSEIVLDLDVIANDTVCSAIKKIKDEMVRMKAYVSGKHANLSVFDNVESQKIEDLENVRCLVSLISQINVNATKSKSYRDVVDANKETQSSAYSVKVHKKLVRCVFFDLFACYFYADTLSSVAICSKNNVKLTCSSIVNAKELHDMVNHRNVHKDGFRMIETMDGDVYKQSTNTGLRGVKNDLEQNIVKYVELSVSDPRMKLPDNLTYRIRALDNDGLAYENVDDVSLYDDLFKLNVNLFGFVYQDKLRLTEDELMFVNTRKTIWDLPLKFRCHAMYVNAMSIASDDPVFIK
jgi:hypothetical protein